MDEEDSMLNEISQSQMDQQCMIPLYKASKIELDNRMVVTEGWGKSKWGVVVQ